MATTLLGLLGLVARPALATEALDSARAAVADGDDAGALRWAVKALRETQDARREATIFLLMAAIYARTGRAEEAAKMYFEALVRRPDFELASDAPAEQRAAFEAAVAATRAAPTVAEEEAPAAPPPTPDAEAERLVAAAQAAYEALDYELVMPALRRALELEPPRELQIRIYALEARLRMSEGQPDQAQESLVRVLQLDPRFALPAVSSPKLLDALEAVRAEVAAPPAAAPAPQTCSTNAPPPAPLSSVVPCTDCAGVTDRWWFWGIIGAVVAGGVIGTTLAIAGRPAPPTYDYGPIELP